MKQLRPWFIAFAIFFLSIGCFCGLPWSYMNLIGVPMQERQSMNPVEGWEALAVAVLCFSASYALYRFKINPSPTERHEDE